MKSFQEPDTPEGEPGDMVDLVVCASSYPVQVEVAVTLGWENLPTAVWYMTPEQARTHAQELWAAAALVEVWLSQQTEDERNYS